jgi:hypothetical protein
VSDLLQGNPEAARLEFAAERLCMLLLLQPPSAWAPAAAWADPGQHAQWQKLLETSAVSILESEAKYLRHQFSHIGEVIAGGGDHAVEDCGTCTPPKRGGGGGGGAGGGGGGAGEGLGGPCGPVDEHQGTGCCH